MTLRLILSLSFAAACAFPQAPAVSDQKAAIDGKIVSLAGEPLGKATVRLSDAASTRSASAPSPSNYRVTGDGSGNFHFDNIEPGRYTLSAERNGYLRQSYGARSPGTQGVMFDLASGMHMTSLTLTMTRQGIISGTVEDEEAEGFGRRHDTNLGFASVVNKDGTFEMAGLTPATFRINLNGLAPGCYLKRIQFGGVDITHENLDLTSGSGGTLEILLSSKAATVSGTVRNEKRDLLPKVTVTMWTPRQPSNGVYDPPRDVNTDANGAFKMDNLAPGDYRVAGWEEIEPGVVQIPDFQMRFEGTAAKMTLQELSQATLELKVVSRDAIQAEVAKLP